MKRFKVGIDNYGLFPLKMEPMEVLRWAAANGSEGVQFSGLAPEKAGKIDLPYLGEMKQIAESENLYIEWGGGQHVPRDMVTWERKEIFETNRRAAEEAETLGTRIVRSCSGGLMRWDPSNPETEVLLSETAECLRSQRSMLRDHNAILAVETHFEFTSFELLRLFEMCDVEPGDCLGVCLDTMNLLTMLEDPLMGTGRLLPWVVSTHVKDGAILLDREGLTTFPTEIGKGVVDLAGIVSLLDRAPQEVNLSIEDHGGSFSLPIFDEGFLSRFPDLTARELSALIRSALAAEESVERGDCSITERGRWPSICEERMKGNLRSLKEITAASG